MKLSAAARVESGSSSDFLRYVLRFALTKILIPLEDSVARVRESETLQIALCEGVVFVVE